MNDVKVQEQSNGGRGEEWKVGDGGDRGEAERGVGRGVGGW